MSPFTFFPPLRAILFAISLLLAAGCAASSPQRSGGLSSPAIESENQAQSGSDAGPALSGLEAIALIHGDAGVWAVAGYRMGAYALEALDLPHGSFDLEVIHHTPPSVQFSCMADGAAAATGASLGKLNLRLEPATAEETRTTYLRRSTGASITLRATEAFVARYLNVERERLVEVGEQVFALPDEAIFEEVPSQE